MANRILSIRSEERRLSVARTELEFQLSLLLLVCRLFPVLHKDAFGGTLGHQKIAL